MIDTDIRELVSLGETEGVEFKVGTVSPAMLARVVSAFANTSGGKILVGVDERHGIVGCDRDRFRRVFEATQRQIKGSVDMVLDFVSIDGKEVGIVFVEGSDDVVMSRDGIFARRGTADLAMTPADIRKRISPEPSSINRLIEFVSEQTKRIGELQEEISKSNRWQAKAIDYLIGGLVGAILGLILTLALT